MANTTLVELPTTHDDWVAQLYAEHRLGLIRLAILLVDDLASAEDVVHDVFASVVHNDSLRVGVSTTFGPTAAASTGPGRTQLVLIGLPNSRGSGRGPLPGSTSG